ncbi:hypothetical protein Syn7803C75_73 [Synechococcus phage ACG-2014d]|uniref:YHYH domain-containing protein n=1 Tax=Synechococcus phage ACG-2014d TaxID=1493509 RepID=A0A0E3F1Q4_9CAUD|nr:hypothetical protein Syn7803C75_73 [Synechococcus phage ACG-2014d]
MPQSNTTAVLDNGVLTVTTDQRPEPALYGTPLGSGNFPNNPNTVDGQDGSFAFAIRAGTNTEDPHPTTLGPQGIALNGVVLFSPSNGAGALPGQTVLPAEGFSWNTVFNESTFGVDACGGHARQNGEYHYHSGSFLVNCWGNDAIQSNVYYSSSQHKGNFFRHPDGHSKIIGFCFDGYPIYGPFGYESVEDRTTGTKKLRSSFRILTTPADGRGYSYSQYTAGSFIQDYEYVNGLGDLDEFNGRYCQTPEYPDGTYAYFLSLDEQNNPVYPYIFGPTTKEQRTWPEEGSEDGYGGANASLSDADILRITKTWSEATFNYDSVVSIPAEPPEGSPPLPSRLPVTILLHDDGGNGSNTVNKWRSVLPGDILVAPTGYISKWNIVDENKAPDMNYLIQLIRNLREYPNVAPDQFRIVGTSNGGALALRAFLELNDVGLTTVVAELSSLHINQWRNGVWYAPQTNEDTASANDSYGYTRAITPPTGRKIMTIANTNDTIIPYDGGVGGVPNTIFYGAQFSAQILAESQGYTGDQLGDAQGVQYNSTYPDIYLYKYFNNSVVHVKSNTGHNTNAGHETLIRQYIESGGTSAG